MPNGRAMPNLSACIIMRNEERVLGRCLASIKAICDEVCILDNGSTDRSVEIAKKAGARVYVTSRFSDSRGRLVDFAAARNYVLSKANGDWVLSIDADEVLSTHSGARILRHLRNERISAVAVSVRSRETSWPVVRLFRMNCRVRFQGIVHEYVVLQGPLAIDRAIEIVNIPDKRSKESAADRDLRLCRIALRRDPLDARSWLYMARAFQKRADYVKAIAYFLEYLNRIPRFRAGRHFAFQSIAICFLLLGQDRQAAVYARKAVQLDRRSSQALCLLGDAYAILGRIPEAIACFRRAKKARMPETYPFFVDERFHTEYPDMRLQFLASHS